MRNQTIENLEEERRLFYVGMTRAKQRLILLHTKSRFYLAKGSNRSSRFLNDIEEALKKHQRAEIKERKKKRISSKINPR